MKKGYAIVWKTSIASLGVEAGEIVSIHLDKPVVSQDMLWEVREIEFKIINTP